MPLKSSLTIEQMAEAIEALALSMAQDGIRSINRNDLLQLAAGLRHH